MSKNEHTMHFCVILGHGTRGRVERRRHIRAMTGALTLRSATVEVRAVCRQPPTLGVCIAVDAAAGGLSVKGQNVKYMDLQNNYHT